MVEETGISLSEDELRHLRQAAQATEMTVELKGTETAQQDECTLSSLARRSVIHDVR